jgi:predicted nucleic acid-binding protein
MILLDVNLLIYAVNEDAPSHRKAKSWLETTLSGTETVGLS